MKMNGVHKNNRVNLKFYSAIKLFNDACDHLGMTLFSDYLEDLFPLLCDSLSFGMVSSKNFGLVALLSA